MPPGTSPITLTPYANRSGDSGVRAFAIIDDAIAVQFSDSDRVYVYTRQSAGARHLAKMKALAALGRGLSAYISQYVKDGYAGILPSPKIL